MALSFAPHLDVVPVAGRGLVVIGERGCELYSGEVFAQIGALVDGGRPGPIVLAHLAEEDREAGASALSQLQRSGVLLEVPGESPVDAAELAWWTSQQITPQAVAGASGAAVHVRALGSAEAEPVAQALTAAGLRVLADEEADSTLVVLVEDYLDTVLSEINAAALDSGRRWLLCQPGATPTLIGPLFTPDRGPCWECLAQRLRANRSLESLVRRLARASDRRREVPVPAWQQHLPPAVIATELKRALAGANPPLETSVLALDGRNWTTVRHHLVWRPQCPACGAGEVAPEATSIMPVRLRSADAPGGTGGELRSVSARATLERFEHHVSPLTGAVHTLARAPGPAHLHAYMSGGPMPLIHGESGTWPGLPEQMSGGKGTTDEGARASALCEALERHSGGFSGSEPRRMARIDELGADAIAPNDYMHFSERQFAEREARNADSRSYRTFVPEPFDPAVPIEWSPVWSLTAERTRWLPTGLCYYGAHGPGAQFSVGESNGNAAGNTLEEAVLHGLLELVERDHVALWWYNRIPAPGLDLDTIRDPWLAALRAQIASEGRELWALDLTADLGIPVAAALVAAPDGSGVGMGLGAHTDLRGAVIRAATELAQLGLGAPSGGLGTGADPSLNLHDHGFARPAPEQPPRDCREAPDLPATTVLEALDSCRRAIESRGMEVLVLDQTRPDIGLPVVKVVVPELRHFWPRFGPGRLYDVPVALGRVDQPRREDELNPVSPVS